MNNFEHYLKKIKEGFDPSKSSSPDAPWNQTSFTEQNEDMLEYAENKLGYTKDEIEDFMSGNGYNAWETDIENLWPDLYMRVLTKGYDEEHDTPIYNDAYKKIEAEVKKSTGADYKKFKYELKKALDRYVVDTCLEDLRNLYLNHIPKNETYGPSLSKIARKSIFTIDAFGDTEFPGFTFGANWNGWATPYFEKEVADMVMSNNNKINGPEYQMVFKNDSYTVGTDGDEDTTDKQVIVTEDGEKTVWAVGAFSWTWHEKNVQNESTTFNVPTLIQLFYVEDANKRAVGLYKDLETAEKLEMQSKGKKYIINVDRDQYNNGKINASNAKYYVTKNEAGELVPVQAGEVIKLQKPAADTFTNSTINNDGAEIADCTVCGATGVVVGDHICKTVVEPMAQVDSEYNMVERFSSIRKKYGVNESKMITKIGWFKAILESPSDDGTKRSDDSNGELRMSPEQIATEVKRLFDRYNNEEIKADILAMFPDFKTLESEDAAYHVLDTIFESEGMSDSTWKAIKDELFNTFKNYFENN